MKKYVLTLDLIDDPQLILAYEEHHQRIWPEIKKSIIDAGVLEMEIYRFGTRLMMIMHVKDSFSFQEKQYLDAVNPVVQEWEKLMWKYQLPVKGTKIGEKWVLMEKIFQL